MPTGPVLTLAKVNVYRHFSGDIDGFARSGSGDRSGITDEDWALITELQQAASMVRSGKATPEFAASLEGRLMSVAVDEVTRQAIRDLGNKHG